MQGFSRKALVTVVLGAAVLVPQIAGAGGTVGILVLKEHGIGSAAQAQPYIDKLVAAAKTENGWADAKGQYQTTRSAADSWIQAEKPSYGILSLAAFLAYKGKHNVELIGAADVAGAGGQQYFVISKTQSSLAGCKGKKLASDHADDKKFIDGVVFAGAASLGEFTVEVTTRPIQTLKKVEADEADCALIDDAQLAQMGKAAPSAKQIWKSAALPPMAVVAFPSAPAAEKAAFQKNLGKLCQAQAQACQEVGLKALRSTTAAEYATVVGLYK